MNKTLASILEVSGHTDLKISNQKFTNELIIEEFLDCCLFSEVTFVNCIFDDCHILGGTILSCNFDNCKFEDCVIRKSEITDSNFVNCEFLNSRLSPKLECFSSIFKNCKFLNIDLSFALLVECHFIEIHLNKVRFEDTSIIEPKIKDVIFSELEFNEAQPMRFYKSKENLNSNNVESIEITNSLSFEQEILFN